MGEQRKVACLKNLRSPNTTFNGSFQLKGGVPLFKGIKEQCFRRLIYVARIVSPRQSTVFYGACGRVVPPIQAELWRRACEKVIWLERHPRSPGYK